MFRKMVIFYGQELSSSRPPPNWITTLCRLSKTAYLIYPHLPPITEGRSSIRNVRTRRAMVTGSYLSQYAENKRKYL
jgi:hypothetical protein